jgi:hypothetical protein
MFALSHLSQASDGQVFQIHKVSDGVYKDHILENEACQCSMDGPDGPKDLFELKLIGRKNRIPDECSSGTPGQTPLSPFVSEMFSVWVSLSASMDNYPPPPDFLFAALPATADEWYEALAADTKTPQQKEILEKVLDVQYPGLMGDLGIEYGEDDGSVSIRHAKWDGENTGRFQIKIPEGFDRKLDVEKVLAREVEGEGEGEREEDQVPGTE